MPSSSATGMTLSHQNVISIPWFSLARVKLLLASVMFRLATVVELSFTVSRLLLNANVV
jgi:hypothetical protein